MALQQVSVQVTLAPATVVVQISVAADGLSAYQSYVATTADDPVLSEAAWVAAMVPPVIDPDTVIVATPAEGDMIQRVSGSWITRTIAQIKTALGLGSAAYTEASAYAASGHTHAQLHDSATVTGNGLSITGQQISLNIGTGATQVAAGDHGHSDYLPIVGGTLTGTGRITGNYLRFSALEDSFGNTTVDSFSRRLKTSLGAVMLDWSEADALEVPYGLKATGGNPTAIPLTGGTFALTSDIPLTLPASDVSAWAKSGTKPAYSAAEVGAATAAQGTLATLLELQLAASDEISALTVGDGKVVFRSPCAFVLTGVRASVTTAATGATLQVQIRNAGNDVLSTKLSIDATEKTSTTAATPAVINATYQSFADDAEIHIDLDQIGSTVAGAGLKITLIGTRA